MAWIEGAGVPTVGIACRGFTSTTEMVARYEGLSGVRLVEYPPPNISVQSQSQVYDCASRLLDQVV
jgi:hypothetical protein